MPLSRGIIQARAKKIAEQLGFNDFTAYDGWFRGWRWRYEIGKSVRLHGETGDINLIFFYRCMPNRTYIVGGGDVRQIGKET